MKHEKIRDIVVHFQYYSYRTNQMSLTRRVVSQYSIQPEIDWLSSGFMSHLTQNRSFWRGIVYNC